MYVYSENDEKRKLTHVIWLGWGSRREKLVKRILKRRLIIKLTVFCTKLGQFHDFSDKTIQRYHEIVLLSWLLAIVKVRLLYQRPQDAVAYIKPRLEEQICSMKSFRDPGSSYLAALLSPRVIILIFVSTELVLAPEVTISSWLLLLSA